MSCEEEDTCLEQRVDIGLEVAAYPRVTLEDSVGIKSYLPVIVHVSNTLRHIRNTQLHHLPVIVHVARTRRTAIQGPGSIRARGRRTIGLFRANKSAQQDVARAPDRRAPLGHLDNDILACGRGYCAVPGLRAEAARVELGIWQWAREHREVFACLAVRVRHAALTVAVFAVVVPA